MAEANYHTLLYKDSGPFGRPLRENHFAHHAPNVLRLNNGSFGSCPREVLKVSYRVLLKLYLLFRYYEIAIYVKCNRFNGIYRTSGIATLMISGTHWRLGLQP